LHNIEFDVYSSIIYLFRDKNNNYIDHDFLLFIERKIPRYDFFDLDNVLRLAFVGKATSVISSLFLYD
jgi:hypothetical protein